ncbi:MULTISPECIES: flagellar basal body-associated protein FliL [Methylobacterium]|jgi:flagellar FliL protein|uniref:Flagellar protein FliL n=1 Tax=Methylobacterium bullatum TaxID=570505 RepID=A0A679K0S0_9HYPH|nr:MULTISPECIES: flagellar basal body-associated protein FliL [Methylobacterium]KQO51749.1 flagellar basal body-associated protein FliL [Methylobacterium sp. Leaf85]KQP03353.1 flagellar basal body-associated protein FliL [Methylobacterium sp. Leaf93]KQP53256.1 flagellar basal body-associated protein FliL [Methylobacterium sp. Leaf106]MBD8902682.1 flagellar basal body-associated protein FliL [Methylobacterium bullatum]TXN34016.1 flagellar basal body-associated protein FliL [Methylobacterium sp.
MAKKPKTAPAADGEDAGGEAPKGGKKKIIMIGAAVLVLAGGGGFFMMKKKGGDDHAAVEVKKPLVFLEVREMVVNLANEPGQDKPRTAKVKVSLELKDAKVEGEVKPLMPRIEDTFQVYMRELRPSDLAGSAGLYRLREELLRRVNVAIHPARAEAVLFKDVIVQ